LYNVLDVCRYVINYSNDKDYGISNLKLQKVLYFIQAYFLISTPEQCFRERIEAWDFGPVVPEAYREYKQFGSSNIPNVSYYVEMDFDDFWKSKVKKYRSEVISDGDKRRIEAVVDRFSDYSATDLVGITHNQAPWMDAYVPNRNNEITPQAIKEYFNG
jgi:uncharacterized phage-associated protein